MTVCHGMGRRSPIRFVAALVVTLVLGGTTLWVVANQRSAQQTTPHRPTPAPSEAYRLEWRSAESAQFREVLIAKDGAGCEILDASELLRKVCVLATNVDSAMIATDAYGRINSGPTPALEAVMWRGIVSGDTGVCARAGLREQFLNDCVTTVEGGERTITDGDLTVRVGNR